MGIGMPGLTHTLLVHTKEQEETDVLGPGFLGTVHIQSHILKPINRTIWIYDF